MVFFTIIRHITCDFGKLRVIVDNRLGATGPVGYACALPGA
jgi:hypothetical protein